MLFLLRPRQTWMPFARPRERMQQDAYNRSLQDAYTSTRSVAPVAPVVALQRDPYAELRKPARLHQGGALTDDEFAQAKARVLDGDADDDPT